MASAMEASFFSTHNRCVAGTPETIFSPSTTTSAFALQLVASLTAARLKICDIASVMSAKASSTRSCTFFDSEGSFSPVSSLG